MKERGQPDPDEILARIKEAEAAEGRARFTVFFGMCAGVGKTYAMLQEARSARSGGADIVVALAETHGRPETEALLAGLEQVPTRRVSYRGVALEELDVDAVVERRPEIAIVDELAHTNAPGSRHVKRWQDALELLDRGICVWTAINVQHVESLADVVEDFAGTAVRERVPDSVFDRADEIRLIDVTPEGLIQRLEEGKVYTGESSRAAIEGFFRPRNLGAFRELSLRFVERKAERALSAYARAEGGLPSGANLGGNLLVAVGPAPSSAYLVRWARRTAYALREGWIAVHVDTGMILSRQDHERLEANLALARKLGAETIVVQGVGVAETVVETARARGASMIVIGRSGLSHIGLLPRRATVSDRIVREAGAIDVAVVQDSSAARSGQSALRLRRFFAAPPRQYALLVAAVSAVTGMGALAAPYIGYRGIALVYLAAVLGLSFVASPIPLAALTVVSALALNFFFIPPLYTFTIGSAEDILFFAIYFLVSAVTGGLVARLRSNERMHAERERRAAFLFRAAQRLAECRSAEEAADEAALLVEEHFDTEAAVLVADETGALANRAAGSAAPALDERERAAAAYSFTERAVCGAGTDSLPESRFHYAPATARERASGVIALRLPEDRAWTRSDDNLLFSLGRILALAVERERSDARSRHTALELEAERLSTALLNSVSHELRTPLTTITGSISALRDKALAEDEDARGRILEDALAAADRLDRIVEEILSMSRIESGAMRLKLGLADPSDIVEAALREAGPELGSRDTRVVLPDNPEPVFVDEGLVARLTANLLKNAATYSRPGEPIELRIEENGDTFAVVVRDHGPGIPPAEIDEMFERFKRGRGVPNGGIGLGLAICKGIVAAHGGSISARSLADGGFELRAIFPSRVDKK